MKTEDGYIVTPESLAIESLGTKLSVRADTYLKRLEAVSTAQERQARRSLWAAIASAVCAGILAAVGVVSLLTGDNKDTSYAHCQMVVMEQTAPLMSLMSACMRAAGYRDLCREENGNSPGTFPECFVPAGLFLRVRDAIR